MKKTRLELAAEKVARKLVVDTARHAAERAAAKVAAIEQEKRNHLSERMESMEAAALSAANVAADAVALHLKEQNGRIKAVELALVKVGVLADSLENLKLVEWKTDVGADMRWIKLLMGGTAIAAIGQLVVNLVRGG